MGNHISKAKDSLFHSKRKGQVQDEEYTQEDIKRQFQNIPTLTDEEKQVIRSSWKSIAHKIEKVKENVLRPSCVYKHFLSSGHITHPPSPSISPLYIIYPPKGDGF